MNIEHIALYVQDLEGARDFFARWFGGIPNEGYHNRKTDFRSYFLCIGDGSRLELMTRPGLEPGREGGLGYAHLAFSAGSAEAVDSLTAQLAQAGYAVLSGPRVTGGGYYESCVRGFEGILIEITI